MASGKLDDVLRNYEHAHVREELGEWLHAGGKDKHVVCAKNQAFFKFKVHYTFKKGVIGEFEHSQTMEIPCFAIDHSSLAIERTLPNARQGKRNE